MKLKIIFVGILSLSVIFTPGVCFAVGSGGFENASHSAKGLGRGSAFTARADDPSALAYNTAGISQLEGIQVSGGFAGINLITKYYAAPGGVNTRSASKLVLSPNFYTTVQVPKLPLHIGFGINAPYGLKNHYSSTSPFRYVGYKNELMVLAYNISGSIQLTPKISVGAGAMYYDSSLTQWAKVNSTRVTQGVVPGFPALPDANLKLDADGNGWGWNIGALWKLNKKNQIGFYYRSAARLAYKGYLTTENIQGPVMLAIFGGQNFKTGINTDIVLPPNATIGYQYKITPNWDIEFDFGWTGWQTFDHQEFAIGNPNPVLSALTPIPRGYHNTFSFMMGSDWEINKYVTLRGGYFFFQAPGRDGNAGPVIPDAARNGFSVGLGLNYKNLTIDMTYLAEPFADRTTDQTSIGNASGVIAEGKYQSFINVFSFNVTYRFGLGSSDQEDLLGMIVPRKDE